MGLRTEIRTWLNPGHLNSLAGAPGPPPLPGQVLYRVVLSCTCTDCVSSRMAPLRATDMSIQPSAWPIVWGGGCGWMSSCFTAHFGQMIYSCLTRLDTLSEDACELLCGALRSNDLFLPDPLRHFWRESRMSRTEAYSCLAHSFSSCLRKLLVQILSKLIPAANSCQTSWTLHAGGFFFPPVPGSSKVLQWTCLGTKRAPLRRTLGVAGKMGTQPLHRMAPPG